jgi:hypothetical protein
MPLADRVPASNSEAQGLHDYLTRGLPFESIRVPDGCVGRGSARTTQNSRGTSVTLHHQLHHRQPEQLGYRSPKPSRVSSIHAPILNQHPSKIMPSHSRVNRSRISQMVEGLEEDHHRLMEDNKFLRRELGKARDEADDLRQELMDVEAERDDYRSECNTARNQPTSQQNMIYQQIKAEFDQKYQVLDILMSNMDHDTWFAIIASREEAYQANVQKQRQELNAKTEELKAKTEEIERLKAINRQNETEMEVLRSFCKTLHICCSDTDCSSGRRLSHPPRRPPPETPHRTPKCRWSCSTAG